MDSGRVANAAELALIVEPLRPGSTGLTNMRAMSTANASRRAALSVGQPRRVWPDQSLGKNLQSLADQVLSLLFAKFGPLDERCLTQKLKVIGLLPSLFRPVKVHILHTVCEARPKYLATQAGNRRHLLIAFSLIRSKLFL